MGKAASDQEKFISNFRLCEYGINEDGYQKKEFAPLSRRLKNSIELLSTGLYGKDIHFILELIQNAEDNNYTELSPELEFLILDEDPTNTPSSEGCLCLFNNEVGFAEPNVESICGIGQSTKDKAHGYIGEKGIGFKSVFVVSSQPHIYSNGFRFYFKEDDPILELSYIVPYWLDCVPDVVREKRSNTAILLPLKEDKKKGIIAELERIEPETILFLAKLEGLAIEVQSSGKKIELIRDKSAAPITDLLVQINGQQDHISRYWMHEESIAVPSDVSDDKRVGVNDRVISVAFPLEKADDRGKVFAFLPTDVCSGLPFIVNADFILSASRETIQTDRKWNEWLRSSLAEIVLNGIKQLLENKEHRVEAYRFIPLTKNLQTLREYFSPICEVIHAGLANSDVVLSDRGVLNTPELSRLASKKIRHLFKNERRPSAFTKLNFVAAGIEQYSEQLKAIGVKAFLTGDLKQCLSDREWLKDQDCGWFIELYTYLHEAQKAGISMVNKLPIILLDGGDVVSPSSGAVYFPSDKDAIRKLKLPMETIGCPGARFLHVTAFEAMERSSGLREWASTTLGLIEFNVSNFIVKTLVPWADDHAGEYVVNDVMQLTQLILDNWHQLEEKDIAVLKESLPVALKGGRISKRAALKGHELLTPKGLDPEKGWQLFLMNDEDYAHHDVLADEYLDLKTEQEILNGFLDGVGGERCPDLKNKTFSKYYGYKDSPYKLYLAKYDSEYPSSFTSTPELSCWMPPVTFFDETLRKKKKYRSALIWWMAKMLSFPARLDSLNRAKITWFYYSDQVKSIESGFHYYLFTTAWIYTNKGYKKPGEVFIKSKQLSEMFGTQLPFLKDDMSQELREYLGIKTEATTESIVEYLEVLSTDDDVDFKLVCRLYKYLDGYGKGYEHAFASFPLIYLPGSGKEWFKCDEVVWEDLSSVFGDLYPGLGPSYENRELRNFFLKKLSVSGTVGAEELARAWLALAKSDSPDPEKTRKALEKIMPKILEIAASIEDKPDWWHEFVEDASVWTQDERFISQGRVLAADDRQLQRFFSGRIPFIWKPERYTHREMLPLYTELGVRSLSECTNVSLISSEKPNKVVTQSVLTEHSKRLLGYLAYSHSRDFYLEQIKNGALKALMRGVECECATIEVRYAVKGFVVQRTDKERKAFWDTETSALYLLHGADTDELLDEAAEAIAKEVWGTQSREWDDAVRRVLGVTTKSRYRKLHDTKGWHMPPEESKNLRTLIDSHEIEKPEGRSDDESGPEGSAETATSTPESGPGGSNAPQAQPREPPLESRPKQEPRQSGHEEPGTDLGSGAPNVPRAEGGEKKRPPRTEGSPTTGHRARTGGNVGRPSQRSGRSRSRQTSKRINSARQSRIVSYPYPEPGPELQDNDATKEEKRIQKELGDKAEQYIYELEIKAGNTAKRMPPNNPGYDIESVIRATGEVRYIEVKGQRACWGARGVGLTYTQFKKALEKGKSYWLYVVENVESDNPGVFRINDPANRATEYRYDSNWAHLAVPDDSGQVTSTIDVGNLVEELKGYTDDKACKEIIAHCYKSDMSLPEVGYELASDAGEVIGEIELAWEDDMVAIALPGQDEAASQFKTNNWRVFAASDIEDEVLRGTLFGSISGIEDKS